MFFRLWLPLIALATVVATTIALLIYQEVRRPGWVENPGHIRVPYAKWIVAAIIAAVLIGLGILISKDPLAGRQ